MANWAPAWPAPTITTASPIHRFRGDEPAVRCLAPKRRQSPPRSVVQHAHQESPGIGNMRCRITPARRDFAVRCGAARLAGNRQGLVCNSGLGLLPFGSSLDFGNAAEFPWREAALG